MSHAKTAPDGSRQSSLACPPIQRAVDIPALHAAVKAALGISLIAETKDDTVHGHVSAIHNPDGLPLPCVMCDGTEPHTDCFEVVLYESPEAPDRNHTTTVAAHGLGNNGLAVLREIVNKHRP